LFEFLIKVFSYKTNFKNFNCPIAKFSLFHTNCNIALEILIYRLNYDPFSQADVAKKIYKQMLLHCHKQSIDVAQAEMLLHFHEQSVDVAQANDHVAHFYKHMYDALSVDVTQKFWKQIQLLQLSQADLMGWHFVQASPCVMHTKSTVTSNNEHQLKYHHDVRN
jgi:hypothetical protein